MDSRPGTTESGSRSWRCYVALGDSFTEGLNDPGATPGSWRGWADRLAEHLADRSPDAPVRYANLAVRGRLMAQVLRDQLPAAMSLQADLVSLVAGGNDLLRPSGDPDALAAALERAVVALRAAGADVLLATGMDPHRSPVVRRTRGKVAVYNGHLRSIADRHGGHVLDLWGTTALQDRRMWAPDRVHLTAEGHRRVALRALDALGLPGDQKAQIPLPPEPPRARTAVLRSDLAWAGRYAAPWVVRRLRGRSSGDAVHAKRPVPARLE